jgi:hypothetical protein
MATRVSAGLSPSKLRRFGVTVAVPLVVLSALGAWRGHTTFPAVLAGLGAALAGLALIAPHWLRPVHTYWMRGAEALGWFNTRVLLGLVYFLMMTPIGVLMRLLGRDPLNRRLRDRSSYWIARPRQPNPRDSMERRF